MMLNGLTYTTYQLIMTFADMGAVSNGRWTKAEEDQAKVIKYLLDASCARGIEAAKRRSTGVVMIFDARWSTGRFRANEGTVLGIDAATGVILYYCHLLRKGKAKNYQGSSKSMEGEGVKQILQQMKEDHLNLTGVIHDGDASTMAHVRSV
jgi:hypothetical protein